MLLLHISQVLKTLSKDGGDFATWVLFQDSTEARIRQGILAVRQGLHQRASTPAVTYFMAQAFRRTLSSSDKVALHSRVCFIVHQPKALSKRQQNRLQARTFTRSSMCSHSIGGGKGAGERRGKKVFLPVGLKPLPTGNGDKEKVSHQGRKSRYKTSMTEAWQYREHQQNCSPQSPLPEGQAVLKQCLDLFEARAAAKSSEMLRRR